MTKKYYVIEAEIIDSNFPDDIDKMQTRFAVLETDLKLDEIQDKISRAFPEEDDEIK